MRRHSRAGRTVDGPRPRLPDETGRRKGPRPERRSTPGDRSHLRDIFPDAPDFRKAENPVPNPRKSGRRLAAGRSARGTSSAIGPIRDRRRAGRWPDGRDPPRGPADGPGRSPPTRPRSRRVYESRAAGGPALLWARYGHALGSRLVARTGRRSGRRDDPGATAVRASRHRFCVPPRITARSDAASDDSRKSPIRLRPATLIRQGPYRAEGAGMSPPTIAGRKDKGRRWPRSSIAA